MEPAEDFLVVEEEVTDQQKDCAEMIRDVVHMFNNSIAALNQSTILLRDELQNALSITLQRIKTEDSVDVQEIMKAFSQPIPLACPDSVRRDYVTRLCSRLMACEAEKQTLQLKCESLETSCYIPDVKNHFEDIGILVGEIEGLVQNLDQDHSNNKGANVDPDTDSSECTPAVIEKRLCSIRDRLRSLDIRPTSSATVSAQAGRVSTPEVPKKDANSKLDDKHALTKLASREKLSKSSQSLNDLLTQDKFKMEVMRLLEQDRKSLPRDDSTVYENTSEKCDEIRQDRSSDTVPKDAEVRKAATESKDKSDNSADRYGGDESRYVLNATSAYFPTDSRRFANPQPFFQPRPDALGYGYYRSDAYAYPPPEYYGVPHLRAGPRGFHYMARPRMPHYPPSYRPNQNPVRAPTNFVPPYQQSQKKSPRNPAWIPDFLPELK